MQDQAEHQACATARDLPEIEGTSSASTSRCCWPRLRGQGDAKGAERFARASTHWMRHSHASHAIAGGMPIEIAQQNLGHASLATTTVYVTTEERRRMKAVEAFWRK